MSRSKRFNPQKKLKRVCTASPRICSMHNSCRECNNQYKKDALRAKGLTRR